MRRILALMVTVALASSTFVITLAAGPVQKNEDWYYREGPLRGSLKSDEPLPLYDKNPQHLWNRLFAALYIRTSELPTPPEAPADTTELDEWDHKLRRGELPSGPVVRRIEGGDVSEFLAWPKTRYYSEPATFERINNLLDEFLTTGGERLVTDPLKRAFFQHDLWAVFDHFAGQNIGRFGDIELAKRRLAVPRYLVAREELREGDEDAAARRETMCRKLAVIIKRLALPKNALNALPDNYAAAVKSGQFTSDHQFDPSLDFLPSGLLTNPDEWVELDPWPGTIGNQREGRLTLHTVSFRGRSYFRIFWRFPEGRQQVAEYLDYLRNEGVDWRKTAEQGFLAMKPGLRQIPVGTQVALVRFMMNLDDELNPVPTRVVEEVRPRVYKNVTGAADAKTNTGRGMNVYLYVTRRALLFDKLKHGGLEREPDDLLQYRVFLQEGVVGAQDWGRYARKQTIAQSCLHCHMFTKDAVGLYSMFGHTAGVAGLSSPGIQGIAVPMGSGPVRTYPRGEREARWKLGEEDYLRLVEYARAEVPAQEKASSNDVPHVIIHRQALQAAPQNRWAALKQAVQWGADETVTLEVDLHATKDGRIILYHDPDFEFKSDEVLGPTTDWLWEEINDVDFGSWYDHRFQGERLVLFEDALEFCKLNNVRLTLDIKETVTPEMVRAVLKKRDAERVVYWGWRGGFGKLVGTQIKIMQFDGDREMVRQAATRAPGNTIWVDDPRVLLDVLHRDVPQNREVKMPALSQDYRVKDLNFDALVRLVREGGDQGRIAAVRLRKHFPEQAGAAFASMLRDDEAAAQVKTTAARALGRLGDRLQRAEEGGKAGAALESLLAHDDAEVRAAAAYALGKLEHAPASEKLTKMLRDKKQPVKVRAAAARALGRIGSPRVIGPLVQTAQEERDEVLRVTMPRFRELAREKGYYQVLPHVLSSCYWALGGDPPYDTYWNFALLTRNFAPAEVVPVLLQFFDHPKVFQRQEAFYALLRVGEPAVEPLIGLLKDKQATPMARQWAGWTLGWSNDPRVVAPLTAALQDGDPAVRAKAAWAMGKLRVKRSISRLSELTNDREALVRDYAAEALRRCGENSRAGS